MRPRTIFFVVLALAIAAAAQGPPPTPKPAPEMERFLKTVEGTWQTEEKHEPSPWMPQGGTGQGTFTAKRGPGGLSTIESYQSKSSMGGTFEGHGSTWWDGKQFRSLFCDNMNPQGCTAAPTGRWEGNDFVLTSEQEHDGQKMSIRERLTDITPNSFTLVMEMAMAGGPLKRTMTIHYKRAQ